MVPSGKRYMQNSTDWLVFISSREREVTMLDLLKLFKIDIEAACIKCPPKYFCHLYSFLQWHSQLGPVVIGRTYLDLMIKLGFVR
jgi:hypothetical protein